MEIWLLGATVIVSLFAVVLLVGAPYLPTLSAQVQSAFDLLALAKGQTILELGCGDGKVLVAGAKCGYRMVGIELNPILFLVSWLRMLPYRKQVRVVWGDFWRVKWPEEADAVFVFLLDPFMPKLDRRMRTYKKPLVSIAFQIPGKKPTAQKNGVFLYKY